MKHTIVIYLMIIMFASSCRQQGEKVWTLDTPDGSPVRTVSIDTMNMRNPFISLDWDNLTYYMTGDGGFLWKSKYLREWQGPFNALMLDETQWMGAAPQITAPEIHRYKKKYYYVGTFTRPDVVIGTNGATAIPRRSCQLLQSDNLQGPYKPIETQKKPLLAPEEASRCATFTYDEYGVGYIIYSHDWVQDGVGTTQIIRLSEDCAKQVGDPYIMFDADEKGWSDDNESPSPIMDGPFIFDTEEGSLGIMFATEIDGEEALCVAYSKEGCGLNGPWTVEKEPLLTGGYGQATIFKDFDGTLVLVLHKKNVINGEVRYVPLLLELDNQYKRLKIKGKYNY